ncbi:hypothetical protein EYF80_017875 [Liparis tanakae]|uniref:Uncharacterized protein n=1 Tax=Liparis tanakae TaxID=230148 RepID=A0A4Z2I1R5_9TELE|nr:hypothetical protein EYF80_017875 [Liparis tanakae]
MLHTKLCLANNSFCKLQPCNKRVHSNPKSSHVMDLSRFHVTQIDQRPRHREHTNSMGPVSLYGAQHSSYFRVIQAECCNTHGGPVVILTLNWKVTDQAGDSQVNIWVVQWKNKQAQGSTRGFFIIVIIVIGIVIVIGVVIGVVLISHHPAHP